MSTVRRVSEKARRVKANEKGGAPKGGATNTLVHNVRFVIICCDERITLDTYTWRERAVEGYLLCVDGPGYCVQVFLLQQLSLCEQFPSPT